MKIEEDEALKILFYSSPSRKLLIQLTERVLVNEYSEHWRCNCSNCNTLGWTILRKILGVCTNCILANKIRDVNSQIASTKKDSTVVLNTRNLNLNERTKCLDFLFITFDCSL